MRRLLVLFCGVAALGATLTGWCDHDTVGTCVQETASSPADAPWIGDGEPDRVEATFYDEDPAPLFTAEFTLPEGRPAADFTIACAGYYTLRLNERAVGVSRTTLMPLWSPFDHTVYSDTTRLSVADGVLKAYPATNVVTVLLGNGFYNLPPLRFWGSKCFRESLAHGRPCFRLSVEGVSEPLAWTCRRTNVIRNCVYLGAEIDATRPEAGAARPAARVKGPKGRVIPRRAPPVDFIGRAEGRVTARADGTFVVDFGANLSGVPRFVFANEARGRKIEIVYGERLHEDGRVNVLTQTTGQIKKPGRGGPGAPCPACQRDAYVCAGADEETFEPPFTWHICRYAEIRGAANRPKSAVLNLVSSALKPARNASRIPAEFRELHEVCVRTFRDNLIGVQSDCPGRERLGYGGDIVATCEAMCLNFDMLEFYLKTLQDFADEAADDGWLTETAPYVGIADANGLEKGASDRRGPVSWALGVPVTMATLLRHYPAAEDRILAFYPTCARYVRLMDAENPSGLVPKCIGDHEAIERAPNGVTATAHWYEFARLTAEFARRLGKTEDAQAFEAVAAKIKGAFRAAYVKDGLVANGTQSAQALGLYLGLVPDGQVPAAEALLLKAIGEKGFAPTTGIFTTRYMLVYLAEHGRNDVARRIVLHKGFPGWMHMLERGATSLWESWKESDDTYSNCHPMFGSVDEWILRFSADAADRVSFGLLVSDASGTDRVTVGASEMMRFRQDGEDLVWTGHPRLGAGFEVRAVPRQIAEGTEWTFSYRGNDSGLTVEEIHFPVWTVGRSARAKILYPNYSGAVRAPEWGAHKPGATLACAGPCFMGFHCLAVYDEEGASHYLDQRGEARLHATRLEVRQGGEDGTCEMRGVYEMPLSAECSRAFALPFPCVTATYRGGWFGAMDIYRKWVWTQPWYGRAAARDFSKLKDVALWMWNRGDSSVTVPPVLRFAKDTGLKVALDWYWWHDIPYDTSYPRFWPPREPLADFLKGIEAVHGVGGYVQPYTNGMLCDLDEAPWNATGAREAIFTREGKPKFNVFCPYTNRRQGWMCGEAPEFQRTMRNLEKTIGGTGMDGVYMDMIASAAFGSCHNPAHRHVRGGGRHTTDGYRRYLEAVRADNPGLYLSGEEPTEAYLDLFESLIHVYPSYERFKSPGVAPEYERVPASVAVLHGAVVGFGSFATVDVAPPWDEKWGTCPFADAVADLDRSFPDQFAVEFARGVVWGLQPTVHKFLLAHATEPRYAESYRFIRETAGFYHANRDLLFDGEMLDPGSLRCAGRKTLFLNRGPYTKPEKVRTIVQPSLPTVFHSVWRSRSGNPAAVLVNWSREEQPFELVCPSGAAKGVLPPRMWRRIGLR